jgi:hypothetical protein
MPYRALLRASSDSPSGRFSHEPELDLAEFERRLGQHIFGADSAAEKSAICSNSTAFGTTRATGTGNRLCSTRNSSASRMQRLKWPPEKLAQYDQHLDRLKEIASRYSAATNDGEREMARLAQMVVKRWGKETPTSLVHK